MIRKTCSMHIGKNGLTGSVIEALKILFKNHDMIKISVLKSAAQHKTEVEKMASEICSALGINFTSKVIGHTITMRKWRKPQRRAN
ncbi:MAG: YhbY family RNA-binding protein [archaeon]